MNNFALSYAMQDLYSLLHTLTSNEWSALKIFLTAFSQRGTEGNKPYRLANVLMEAAECPSEKYCSEKIYGTKESAGFRMLKGRLKAKILDFILTDICQDKKHILDKQDYGAVEIYKKAAQFRQLYYSKKRLPFFYNLLEEIILSAKEYEQYPELMEHLRLKRGILGHKKGEKEFNQINKEIQFAEKGVILCNKAENYYQSVMLYNDMHAAKDEKKLKFIRRVLKEIKKESQAFNSPRIRYVLKALELEYFELKHNYKKALTVCFEWLAITKENKSVYRKNRMGIIYDHLSRYEVYSKRFSNAAGYAMLAQEYFTLHSENHCIALEHEFYAVLAMHQCTRAVELVDRMLTTATPTELGEFRFAKYNFLKACVLFKQGKYKEALVILAQRLEISRDKTGWEIGIRTLRIMCFIEIGEKKGASVEIERLRKFTDYNKKGISLRDKTIIESLLFLRRIKFAFDKPNEKITTRLKLLESRKEEYRWEPFTHEVIPFHEWLGGRLEEEGKAATNYTN